MTLTAQISRNGGTEVVEWVDVDLPPPSPGEVSMLRERMDTVERLHEAKGNISRADIESYEPDRAAGHERGMQTREYIARIMRGVQQDMEALEELDTPSEEELSRQLRETW